MVETAPPVQGRAQRSNSLEKGAAVLRALARTPSYHEVAHAAPGDAAQVPPTVRAAPAPAPAPRAVRPLHSARWEKVVVKWEVPRKVLHASIGFVVLALYGLNVDLDRIVRVLSYMLVSIASLDLLRLNVPAFERAYEAVVGALMRDGERVRGWADRRSASTAWCGTWWGCW